MRPPLSAAGTDVVVDEGARILRPDLLRVGSNVRIDAGAIISGTFPVTLGSHVHLAAGSKIFASGGPVTLADFCGLSCDAEIYSATDDYVSGSLTNPTVPDRFKEVTEAPVLLEEHVIVGAGSVVLPGTTLRFGTAVEALSLVRGEVTEGTIVAGVPARSVGVRDVDRPRKLADELRAEGEAGR